LSRNPASGRDRLINMETFESTIGVPSRRSVILPLHRRSTVSVEPSTNWIRPSVSSNEILETGSATLAGALWSSTINAAAWRRSASVTRPS
jgi:hypothetical protein